MTEAVVVPLTFTVPSNTLIRLVSSARTNTSTWVPRTEALTEWPPTWKLAPATRCCTLVKVRPTRCTRLADCRFPSCDSCAAVTVTVVSGDMRTYEPSGNWMTACPWAPVRTELPAASSSPGLAVWNPAELLVSTSTGVEITSTAAGAGTAACA